MSPSPIVCTSIQVEEEGHLTILSERVGVPSHNARSSDRYEVWQEARGVEDALVGGEIMEVDGLEVRKWLVLLIEVVAVDREEASVTVVGEEILIVVDSLVMVDQILIVVDSLVMADQILIVVDSLVMADQILIVVVLLSLLHHTQASGPPIQASTLLYSRILVAETLMCRILYP